MTETAVGYTQGNKPSPTYEEVCSGSTGHTEGIQVYYKPSEVTYQNLVEVLLERTDPTTLVRVHPLRSLNIPHKIIYDICSYRIDRGMIEVRNIDQESTITMKSREKLPKQLWRRSISS